MKCDDCKVDLISTEMSVKNSEFYAHSRLLIPNELRNEELVELEKLEKEVIKVEYDSDLNYYREQLYGSWDGKPEYLELLEELKGPPKSHTFSWTEPHFVDIIAKVCPKCGGVKVVADLIGRRKKMTQLKKEVKRIVEKRKEFNKSEEFEKKEKAKKDREIAKLKKQIEKLGGDS